MTTRDIISKLTRELDAGIETEVQAVYLLAVSRKIIERDNIGGQYPDLKFHCDWALHSKLTGPAAQGVLRKFDAAHALLQGWNDQGARPATGAWVRGRTDLRDEIF
jgi:hypothetical protein